MTYHRRRATSAPLSSGYSAVIALGMVSHFSLDLPLGNGIPGKIINLIPLDMKISRLFIEFFVYLFICHQKLLYKQGRA